MTTSTCPGRTSIQKEHQSCLGEFNIYKTNTPVCLQSGRAWEAVYNIDVEKLSKTDSEHNYQVSASCQTYAPEHMPNITRHRIHKVVGMIYLAKLEVVGANPATIVLAVALSSKTRFETFFALSESKSFTPAWSDRHRAPATHQIDPLVWQQHP